MFALPDRVSRRWIPVVNLLAIGVAGVFALMWVGYFTPWFELFVSFLGLGGILAWLAFVSKILTKRRVRSLQVIVEVCVISHRRTFAFVVLFFIVGTLLASCVCTVEFNATREVASRDVVVFDSAEPPSEADYHRLEAHGRYRKVYWVPWGSQRELTAEVSGYPAHHFVLASGMTRCVINVPADLYRPCVLLDFDEKYIQLARGPKRWKLVIRCGEHSAIIKDHTGEPVWIGVSEDFPVPEHIQMKWNEKRFDLDDANRQSHVRPVSTEGRWRREGHTIQAGELNPVPGMVLEIDLYIEGVKNSTLEPVKISPLRRSDGFVQWETRRKP